MQKLKKSREARPEIAKTASTRYEILAAATKIIVLKGYAACTVRAVAEATEIKAGSIYHHFRSKDEIVREIVNSGLDMLYEEVKSALDELPADASFSIKLEAALEAHIAAMSNKSLLLMQVVEHLPATIRRENGAMLRSYGRLWSQLFRDGMKAGEVDPTLDVKLFLLYFMGGLSKVPEWFQAAGRTPKAVAQVIAKSLLNGLSDRTP